MQLITCGRNDANNCDILNMMFAARKSVFVDLLGWELALRDDRYEIDQFDDLQARYLVITCNGRHAASTRLLPTTRPHILDTLFSHLCEEPVPTGPAVLEITRFCLDRVQHSVKRRAARDFLVAALVDYAIVEAVKTFTGVAEAGWFEQFSKFGWLCRALAQPQQLGPKTLIPFRIDVDANIVERMMATGIYARTAPRPTGMAA